MVRFALGRFVDDFFVDVRFSLGAFFLAFAAFFLATFLADGRFFLAAGFLLGFFRAAGFFFVAFFLAVRFFEVEADFFEAFFFADLRVDDGRAAFFATRFLLDGFFEAVFLRLGRFLAAAFFVGMEIASNGRLRKTRDYTEVEAERNSLLTRIAGRRASKRLGFWPVLDDDRRVDPAADVEPRRQAQEPRCEGGDEVVDDLVGHGFVKSPKIAIRPHVEF